MGSHMDQYRRDSTCWLWLEDLDRSGADQDPRGRSLPAAQHQRAHEELLTNQTTLAGDESKKAHENLAAS
jgi:hypothetical protein